MYYFFFQAEDGIRDADVTGVQTCALPISSTMFQLVVGLGIVLVFVGACGYRWQMLVDEVALKTQIKESKTKELDALKKKVQEVEDYEKNKRLLEDKNRIIEQLRKNQGGPVRLLDYLS